MYALIQIVVILGEDESKLNFSFDLKRDKYQQKEVGCTKDSKDALPAQINTRQILYEKEKENQHG